jgi:hypothetical protein
MSSEEQELRKKLDEYCTSRVRCKGCIFNDAVSGGCLDSSIFTADLKRLEALNRFKKEILGEGKKTITLEFELLEDGYKLITEDESLKEIIFDTKDLTDLTQAEETQAKLEYIFYKVRNGKEKGNVLEEKVMSKKTIKTPLHTENIPHEYFETSEETTDLNYHTCFSDIKGKYDTQQALLDAYRVLVKKAEIHLFDSDEPRLEMHFGESEDAVMAFKRIVILEKEMKENE